MTSINFRAAAFLAEQQRLDFRRGGPARRVRCNPPNRECHGRCIPPNWNCRLKGEGNDPHLRAAGRGTDIVSGLANVQRGLTSIGKGTAKLSLSEIETGRRALARGAAKLHPGDLKKKEQAKKAVYNTALVVLTPLALGITAGLGHRGLKNFRVYREGWGQQIDDTFREVMDRVARNTPGVGDRIRAREEAGLRGLRSVRETEQNIAQNLYSKTQTSSNTLQIAANRRSANSGRAGVTNSGLGELRDAMSAVDRPFGAAPNYKSYGEWSEKSLQAFWSVKRPANLETIAGVGEGSLYSIDSANNLLARSLALSNAEGQPLRLTGLNLKSEAAEVRALIASRLRAEKENIIVGIQQAGLDHKDATSVQQYLQRNAETWRTGNASIDTEIERNIVTLLTGRESELKIADALYRNTVKEYDTFYTNIRDVVSSPPGIAAGPEFDRRRQLYQDALKGHARYLARTIDYPSELPVVGEGGRTLLLKTYYNRRVATPNGRVTTVSLTDRQMSTLAQELRLPSGGFGPELENVLNEHLSQYSIRTGQNRQIVRPLITIRRVQEAAGEARARAARTGTAPEPGAETSATPEAGAPAPAEPRRNRRRRVSEQQIIQRFIKAGFSEERAREKAAEIIAERAARGDSLDTWTARDDAYLETWIRLDNRYDFRVTESQGGTKCGASYIPRTHKCNKNTGPSTTQAPQGQKPATPAGKATPPSTSQASSNDLAKKIVIGTLGVAAATTAIMVAHDAARYFSNKQLDPTGNYRQVLKTQLKKDGLKLKDKDQAIANYYDEVTKNWRPGEMVYYKHELERKGHFGIYLGKKDGRHQFAAAGNNTTPGTKDPLTPNGIISIAEYGPNAKYDGPPVIWGKAPDKVQPPRMYSDTEIVRRATLMLGKPYRLEMLESNCESWASMIVSGVPHSTQVKRFSIVTQALIAQRDKLASKYAGKGHSAQQMATWLAFNHRRLVADSLKVGKLLLKDPKEVLNPSMTELEAMSAIKNYLMTIFTA